jgi:hypothetical protein
VLPEERESNPPMKRIEELTNKLEVIDWTVDGMADYYLFCEVGELTGSYIKLEGDISIGRDVGQFENTEYPEGWLFLKEDKKISREG